MHFLYETDKLKVETEYETAVLKDKITGLILLKEEFYGEPQCALISNDNNWVIVAGKHLVLWTPHTLERIENEELKWIHSIRMKDSRTVEILTDPWGDASAVWELDLPTISYKKIKLFNKYRNKEYTDEIEW